MWIWLLVLLSFLLFLSHAFPPLPFRWAWGLSDAQQAGLGIQLKINPTQKMVVCILVPVCIWFYLSKIQWKRSAFLFVFLKLLLFLFLLSGLNTGNILQWNSYYGKCSCHLVRRKGREIPKMLYRFSVCFLSQYWRNLKHVSLTAWLLWSVITFIWELFVNSWIPCNLD